MSIVIENLCKSFGTHAVLQSFCWTVDRPMVLMGASGCGKTTLLRILLGLETADSGTVTGVVTPAVVFQEDRLCPQLTAVDNLVLTGHGLTAAQARSDLRSLGFTEADLRLPAVRLSGGQKRRAALLRALLCQDAQTLLMDEQDHGYALTGDALSQAAIAAANRSHMPYSKSPSGVALECKDGRIFSGSYAENAAFNPTLPPLQGALILLNLKGYDYPDIQRAVLAEKADAPLIQWDATSATLKALGCHSIDRVLLA